MPTEVRLVTRTLRYNRQAWVRVDGLKAHWKPARIKARIAGNERVELTTDNVSRLVLSMPSGLCPLRLDGHPTVVIDGDELTGARVRTDRSWESLFVNALGRWRAVGRFEFASLAKRPGLQGPIDDAFMDRFLMIRPTGQAMTLLAAQWAEAQLAQALSDWELQLRGKPLIKDDIDLTAADIADCNLILWGDPKSNSAIARVIDQLPLKWNETTVKSRPGGSGVGDARAGFNFPKPAQPQAVCRAQFRLHLQPVRPLEQRHANAQAARLGAGGHAPAVQRRQPGLHRGGRFLQRTLATAKGGVTSAASLPPRVWPVIFSACQFVL